MSVRSGKKFTDFVKPCSAIGKCHICWNMPAQFVESPQDAADAEGAGKRIRFKQWCIVDTITDRDDLSRKINFRPDVLAQSQ